MLRFLRAFAWLRWRILMNALERSGRRDAVERFSRVTEQLGPILLALLLVPGALGLAALGLFAGRAIGGGEFGAWPALTLRFTLLVLFLTAVLSPLLFPAARQPRNLVRLLLLPVPHRVLFMIESASCMADPWIAIILPALLTVPLGLLWAGRPLAAAMGLAGGAALFAVVIGAAYLATSLFLLIMRDRRRGELLAVALVFAPLMFSVLQMAGANRREERRRQAPAAEARRAPDFEAFNRAPGDSPARFFPTEMYAATMIEPAARPGRALGALAGLLVLVAAVQGLSWLVYRRLLAGPAGGGRTRTARAAGSSWERLPGLTNAGSAVALAQLRLMFRAPRGRIALATPLLVTAFLSIPAFLSGDSMSFGLPSGVLFAMLAGAFALLAVGPIALNQFAADGAGLTLELLAPIGNRDLVAGKAYGLVACAVGPALVAQGLIYALFRDTPLALALAPPLATVAAALALAPVWALLSAIFPRAVNLNSIGRDGNPHGMANLLGGLALVAALVPAAGLGLAAVWGLGRPGLAAPLVAVWCGAAWLVGRGLMAPAERILRARRENLALVAQGR